MICYDNDMILCNMVWDSNAIMVWYGMVIAWYDIIWYGIVAVLYGMVWYGSVLCDIVWPSMRLYGYGIIW